MGQETWYTLALCSPLLPLQVPMHLLQPHTSAAMGQECMIFRLLHCPERLGLGGQLPDLTHLGKPASGLQQNPKFPTLSPSLLTGLLVSHCLHSHWHPPQSQLCHSLIHSRDGWRPRVLGTWIP